MKLAKSLCILSIAGAIATIHAEGFQNGPVTFGSGDQAHPGGAKSFSSITLGGTGSVTINTQPTPKVTTLPAAGGLGFGYFSDGVYSVNHKPSQFTVTPSLQFRVPENQIHVLQIPARQVQVLEAPTPQISIVKTHAPQLQVLQSPSPQVRIQQAEDSQIHVQRQQPRILVSGPATSHGYTVNAPGLTKTATFGYPSGEVSITQSAPQVTVAQEPKLQVRLAQSQLQAPQGPQIRIQQDRAPQIKIQQAPIPQIKIQQAPASQIRIQQASAPQTRAQTQQPRTSVSGPATSHGYTVNAPGLTKTATFGYPFGDVTITQSAPRVSVSRVAPRFQVRAPQQQLQVVAASAPKINVLQTRAPQVRVMQTSSPEISVYQAPARRIRLLASAPQIRLRAQQPSISASGLTTSRGYTVNAPKAATLGYSLEGVSVTQSAPRVTVSQAPVSTLQLQVPQQQIRVAQAQAPQIRIQQAPAPQIGILQATVPQIRLSAPASKIRVQAQQPRISLSGPATSHGYTVNAPGLTKTATFGYPSSSISVTQSAPQLTLSRQTPLQLRFPQQEIRAPARQKRIQQQPQYQIVQGDVSIRQSDPRVTVTEQATPKVQVEVTQPQLQVFQSPTPQLKIQQAQAPQLHIIQAQPPQIHVVEALAPQLHLAQTASPQYRISQQPVSTYSVQQPKFSDVKSYQSEVHVIGAPTPHIEISQPHVKTIQIQTPKTFTTSLSGLSAPSVRQQAFNTPSHGYSVSAPGFIKHKTFSGPAVYGTHQGGGGVSGASGIGNVDFSIRQPREVMAKAA
ncbi:hypothetical protein BIW11_10735 [Tropilaelaps mercedesae]|uniref:Uncharacterized protein n=1 Tax=Tropilaelaps mercedesae TaxID=418985 RepID=A0A1V9XEL8_9ACAR|nr:hypothetical protein BIW11_10735 [Tropilaelaps mercedesae]